MSNPPKQELFHVSWSVYCALLHWLTYMYIQWSILVNMKKYIHVLSLLYAWTSLHAFTIQIVELVWIVLSPKQCGLIRNSHVQSVLCDSYTYMFGWGTHVLCFSVCHTKELNVLYAYSATTCKNVHNPIWNESYHDFKNIIWKKWGNRL